MVEPKYVSDFLKPWGRLEYDLSALSIPLPQELEKPVMAATIVERYTVVEARKAQVLGMFRHPDLATFLPVWEAEESEHGRVLANLVKLSEDGATRFVSITYRERLRNSLVNRLLVLARYVPGIDLVFLLTGVIAELNTVVLYKDFASRASASAQSGLFGALARQEGRHYRFYLAAARERAGKFNAVQRFGARFLMRHFWLPVGVDCLGIASWSDAFRMSFSNRDFMERIVHCDEVIDSIEGMEGLNLMRGFLARVGLDRIAA